MKPGIGKAFSFWIVGAIALVALLTPAASVAAQGTGTVTAHARYCTGLSYQGLMGEVGPDCVTGPATFTFYLHGDGTDDSWTLSVGDSGEASMNLTAGLYDVWTPGGPIFNVTVPEDGATSFVYGFPVQAPPSAPAPGTDPVPVPTGETATLNVNTYACTGVSGAPIALGDIGPDCTRVSTNLDFYLWGDGTDDSWNLTTSASGAVSINLQVGGYEVLNTSTWERLGAQVPSGGGTLNIGFAAAAAPAPAPVAETATLNVNTYACTGVSGAPTIQNEKALPIPGFIIPLPSDYYWGASFLPPDSCSFLNWRQPSQLPFHDIRTTLHKNNIKNVTLEIELHMYLLLSSIGRR